MGIIICKWLNYPLAEMQNGHSSNVHETVAEIKAAAKEQTLKVRGASATSLLRAARDQLQTANALEATGDLREALSSMAKAISLLSMFMDSAEFKLEMQPGKKGALTKDLRNFQNVSSLYRKSSILSFIISRMKD